MSKKPKLRFNPFSGERINSEFGDEIFPLITGKSFSSELDPDGKFIVVDMGGVSKSGELISNKRVCVQRDVLCRGDLVMPKDDIGGGFVIGRTCYIPEDDKYVLGDHVYRIRTKSMRSDFLHYLINSPSFNRSIKKKVTGTAQLGLKGDNLSKEIITFPENVDEQQKIASFFTALDGKIVIYAKRIDCLNNLKRGVMRKLFSEIDSCDTILLGDLVGRISSGRTKSVKDADGLYPLCGSTGIIGSCDCKEYSGEKILIARVGANAGTVNFHCGDCGVTDNTLVISSCSSDVSLKWLFHFLIFRNLTKMIFGSGQPLITATQLKNIDVPVPSAEYQLLIVNTLDAMDRSINVAKNKLNCLRRMKKAFMQQMFV